MNLKRQPLEYLLRQSVESSIPVETCLIGYADNLGAFIAARYMEIAQLRMAMVI